MLKPQEFKDAIYSGVKEFSDLYFRSIDFGEIDAPDTKFQNCVFIKCNFMDANFERSDLSGCYLAYSNFQGARLLYAKFNRAILYRADLHFAECRGAVFTEALISRRFVREARNIDISDVINNFDQTTNRVKEPFKVEDIDVGHT